MNEEWIKIFCHDKVQKWNTFRFEDFHLFPRVNRRYAFRAMKFGPITMNKNLQNLLFYPKKALKKQLTDKERIHREEQSIKIDEKDFELIPVSVRKHIIYII